jgi:integrase
MGSGAKLLSPKKGEASMIDCYLGLTELSELYCTDREVTADYRQALRRVAVSMEGVGITPSMLQDSCVSRWLASLPQSPTTRANYRRMALTLWRFAADQQLCDHYPRSVLKVKPRRSPVVAWSRSEMSRLIAAASQYQHTLATGCQASLFFEGWVRCGYETGLRFSDQLHLACASLRDGRLHCVMNKTGQPISKNLTPRLVGILTELSVRGNGRTFFRAHLAERWLRVHFARICRQAGINGTPKFLRRTGATMVEANQPGMAGRFLGHLSHGLAEKHYIDKTLLPNACPGPPQLQ